MNKDWKYEAKKKDVIDIIFDLFFDTIYFLKKNKHIQDIQNFFKKFKKQELKKQYGFEYKDYSNSIEKFNKENNPIKIKEIKIENKITKKKKVITQNTEPTIEQVVKALAVKIDYAKIITDVLVNTIMSVVVIIVGIYEIIKFFINRLINYIKLISKLPFRQMFNILSRISIIIIAIGLSFYLYNHFKSVSTAQEYIDNRINKLEKKVDDDFIVHKAETEIERKRIDKLESTAIIVKHEFVEYNIYDKNGKLHQGKKIR